jgi:Uma2 family endonuclease
MHEIVNSLLNNPSAALIVESVQQTLREEAQRRQEFREWVDDSVKAEFINGEVMLHSPVKRRHLIASSLLHRVLSIFVDLQKLGATAHEKAMISLTRNDYEPDICFWSNEKSVQFSDDTMLHPAPDFVVEVLSKRTSKVDRTIKFQDYARHGIREYWIVDPNKQTVEQYALLVETDTEYLPYGKFSPGQDITSVAIPGFTIPVAAIFDAEANLLALQDLIQGGASD